MLRAWRLPGAVLYDNVPPVHYCVYSALAVDLPAKNPTATASVGKEAEVGTSTPDQGPPVVDRPLRTSAPVSENENENESPVGDSQPATAGMQELVSASSALLSATRDVSTAHNQV